MLRYAAFCCITIARARTKVNGTVGGEEAHCPNCDANDDCEGISQKRGSVAATNSVQIHRSNENLARSRPSL